MKRRTPPFREVLTRVLPISRLPEEMQGRIAQALGDRDLRVLEELTLEAIARLEALGHIRFVEEVLQGEDKFRRYRDLTTGNTLALRYPITEDDEGIYRVSLPVHNWKGAADLDQIRTLFALYNKILTRDSQLLSSTIQILQEVNDTAKRVLRCDSVTFWPAPGATPGPVLDDVMAAPYDQAMADEWVLGQRQLVYIPDLPAQVDPATGQLDTRYQSLAMIPVGVPGLTVHGVLHAWSGRSYHFDETRQGLLGLLAEVATDLFRRCEVLEQLVFVDAGTGVYNRPFFDLQLANEIARAVREHKTFALAIADIDDFKTFNSRYGYEGGNQVLANTAQILKTGLRPFDTVARWGGEEFGLILTPPVTLDDARAACERLRRAAELSHFSLTGLEGQTLSAQLTISIGGAMYPQDGQDARTLWREANAALLEAKRSGKNRVVFAGDLPRDPAAREGGSPADGADADESGQAP
jgi:diguanylate cyclase (GGDEF)-like protein